MPAFSGTLLGRDHGVALPTVARIDADTLIFTSSQGALGEWHLDRVEVIVVGDGYYEVVVEDRRLSFVVDEPDAFEKALAGRRVSAAGSSRAGPSPAEDPIETSPGELGRLGRLFLKRPRHGRVTVRPFPLGIGIAAVLAIGYLLGTTMGDLVDLVTTENPVSSDRPRTDIVVRTFQGSGNEVSPPFAVVAPWEVAWSVEGPDDLIFEVTLREGDETTVLGAQEGPGEGSTTLHSKGVFVIEVASTPGSAWSVQAVEIANPDTT